MAMLFDPIKRAFHLLKTKLKAKRLINMQELKVAAVTARQSTPKEENSALGNVWVLDFREWLTANNLHPSIRNGACYYVSFFKYF